MSVCVGNWQGFSPIFLASQFRADDGETGTKDFHERGPCDGNRAELGE
jgi:hypothetical protein